MILMPCYTSHPLSQPQHHWFHVARGVCLTPTSTMWSPVQLQMCDFSHKLLSNGAKFFPLVSNGCIVSCLSITQNKLLPQVRHNPPIFQYYILVTTNTSLPQNMSSPLHLYKHHKT